jgi:SPP1 family phage portal protein
MIQLNDLKELSEDNINKLVDLVMPELNKKRKLYKRYRRKAKSINIIGGDKSPVVPFERYIVDIASGYLGGKEPTYEVEDTADETKKNLFKKVLDKIIGDKNYKDSMEMIINYICNYNDDGTENYQLVHDILTTGTCYEILYENSDNEYVYSRTNPLQTQAIWDYSIPRQLIGIVQVYEEKDINNKTINVVTLTDKTETRVYKGYGSSYELVQETDLDGNPLYGNHNWIDVPFTCVEMPDGVALFEPVIDLIDAYQELIKDIKETFKYNNEAKLKVTGYRPEEELLVEKDGKLVENEKRKAFDEQLLKMQVFYTPDDGDIDWILKSIDDSAIQNTLKTYIDLIMMIPGIPQTTDLGFTKADNASAIDRKFFSLEQTTTQAMQMLKMAYKRRWELIFGRINLAKDENYDFRDIKITLNKNLPANENEIVDMYMKLRGLISDETIIQRLPLNFDSTNEKNKMDEQDQAQLDKDLVKTSEFNKLNGGNDNPKQGTDEDTKDNKEEDNKSSNKKGKEEKENNNKKDDKEGKK